MYQKSASSKHIHFLETIPKHYLHYPLFVSFNMKLVAFQPFIKLFGHKELFSRILAIINRLLVNK